MQTNILLLPQLSGSLTLATNADFRLTVQFVEAGTTTALDISGIAFRQQWRLATNSEDIGLELSTANGLLVNGGGAGTLSWLVPATVAATIPPGAYLGDLLAEADGAIVNLFVAGALSVTVNGGLTQ